MYKRKRVYAGPATPFKRRRFTKRRSAFRRNVRRNGSTYLSSSKGNAGGRYFGKGTPFSKVKRMRWDASQLSTHYRTLGGAALAIISDPANVLMVTNVLQWLPTSFWTVGGGAINPPTLQPGEDIYIRGGVVRTQFLNVDADTSFVTVWHVRTTMNGTAPFTGTVAALWDPTCEDDFQVKFKVISKRCFTLTQNESMIIEKKIPAQKIDVDIFNNDHNRDYWLFGVQTMVSGSPTNVQITRTSNMSFTVST